MPRVPELVEVFRQYKNILIRGASGFRRYPATFKLVRTDGKITLEKLQNYIQSLQSKYPDRHFALKTFEYRGRTLHIITKKSYVKEGGKIKVVKDRIPIYFDLEGQKVYVPKSYILYNRKLTNYVLMRVLGALGIAKVKYLKMGEP